MNKIKLLLVCFVFFIYGSISLAQDLLQSGPLVGYSAMREVMLWVQTKSAAKVKFSYWNISTPKKIEFTDEFLTKKEEGYTAKLICDKLEPGQNYEYALYLNGKKVKRNYELKFQTQELWQWRKNPPDFSFITGSCAYINETEYDRPGTPYGANYEIFNHIYNKKADFMLWLGDNYYLREADWDSWSGILKRITHTRSLSELQPIWGSMHHYATWDDHDFGPNDSDRGFWNKDKTYHAFKLFWPNPSFGVDGNNSVTTFFQWGDVDFFLLDDRTFKTPNFRKTGKRTLLGDDQIDWLIDNLVTSRAPFKIIALGGQFLNPNAGGENYSTYPDERKKILKLIEDEGIEGVIFLSGDVHRSEITKFNREDNYPLYDFTISPFTAGPSRAYPNDWRLEETMVLDRNFAHVSVAGERKNRVITWNCINWKGEKMWSYSINENELRNKK